MKKILLLNPPGKKRYLRDQYCSSSAKADYYWPAIDLLVLSGILSRDFNIEVVDAIVQKMSAEQTIRFIEDLTAFYTRLSIPVLPKVQHSTSVKTNIDRCSR